MEKAGERGHRGTAGAVFTVVLALLAAAFLLPACGKKAAEPPPLKVGFMICNSLEETRARFDPLVAWLSKVTGVPLEAVYLNTFEVPEAFDRTELDLTHTNSLLYVIMAEKGLLPLAAEKRGSLGFRSAGAVCVKKDSPVRALEDLKGKTMVFGPELAPTGYLAQYEMLLAAGLDPEVDFAFYAIPWGAWKHEKVIYGLWMGAYDAAAVPMLDLEEMIAEEKVGPDDLRVVAMSDPIPYCVFGAAPGLDPVLRQKLSSALFNATPDTAVDIGGERLRILKAAQVDGFVPVEDKDFDRVREMARRANMPPYQRF